MKSCTCQSSFQEKESFPKNYHPISLLPNICKVFEKLVCDKLYTYLCFNNLLKDKNSGFKQGDCTVNQLLALSEKLYRVFDKKT